MAFIHGLGELLKTINFDFVFKITKKFPDLDPDKRKEMPWPPAQRRP
ncbi:MAG: hypothetical protein M0006_03835 [Magnetospirillum sp.]|nr:hypothetical protein [Magnetospirillum sp.]